MEVPARSPPSGRPTPRQPLIDQYIDRLKQLHAIAVDAGAQDIAIAETVKALDQVLSSYGIQHIFGIYEGTHTSRIAVVELGLSRRRIRA